MEEEGDGDADCADDDFDDFDRRNDETKKTSYDDHEKETKWKEEDADKT